METKDYEKILDAMQGTGVYVMRQDTHELLYFNRRVSEAVPGIRLGSVCHRAIGGPCGSGCPLLTMGDKTENRSISYHDAFGGVVDLTATKTLWEGDTHALIITISPHLDSARYAYKQILRADLKWDSFRTVRGGSDNVQGGTLSAYLEHLAEEGMIHQEDRERYLSFVKLDHLREGMLSGQEVLDCTYRFREGGGFRWTLLEVVRGYNYSEENQTVVVGFKDVHDILRNGLDREENNSRSQEIIRFLGEQNDGVYLVNLDTDLVNLVRVDGVDQEDKAARNQDWMTWMRRRVRDRVHPAYQEGFLSRFSLENLRRAAQDKRREEKYIYLCAQGEEYHYVSAFARLRERSGGGSYAVIAVQDVNDRVRQELAHAQRDMQMAAVLKSRYQIMNTVNLENGQCERVFLDRVGTTQDNQTGDYETYVRQAAAEAVHPEDAADFLRVMSLGHLRETAALAQSYQEEICQYRLRGEPVRWVEQHVIYSRQGGKGPVVSILGRDITKEKAKEDSSLQALRDRSEIIRSMSSLFFSTYYVDLEQATFRVVNQLSKVEEVLGGQVDCDAALEVYARNFIHPDDQEEYLRVMNVENWRNTLRWWHPLVALEYRRRPENGEHRLEECGWIRATAVLAQSSPEGLPKTVVYVAQDVTESKQKELREQQALKEAYRLANHANAAKSEFLSRMSHDIRTPMNGIIGMTAIATAHVEEKERVLDCLNKIAVSGRHLLSLVNEVLDMSQIESGKITLAKEPFRISGVIEELAVILRSSIQEKGHQLRIHPMLLQQDEVVGDRARLQQVFVNILGNAVKYTPDGGLLEIAVTQRESAKQGYGRYEFLFMDNGVGMDEEFVKRVFEPFSRAEEQRISKIEGAGLGMAIAQNIVRMMGGVISVDSRPGQGSRFTVTVYLKRAEEEEGGESGPIQSLKDFAGVSFAGRRVLLAEDNEINQEIAMEIIGGTGAEVVCVDNGKAAAAEFAAQPAGWYDLIFMDIQMPVMDGCSAAQAIRAMEREDAKTVPIIAMSANAFAEDILASREAGMNEHITKPLDFGRLMGCMDRWLNREGPGR